MKLKDINFFITFGIFILQKHPHITNNGTIKTKIEKEGNRTLILNFGDLNFTVKLLSRQ
jgi:hypothetical protein